MILVHHCPYLPHFIHLCAFFYPLQYSWASLVAQLVKNLPAMWETWVRSLGWEDPLEKGKATHSSIGSRQESDMTKLLSLQPWLRLEPLASTLSCDGEWGFRDHCDVFVRIKQLGFTLPGKFHLTLPCAPSDFMLYPIFEFKQQLWDNNTQIFSHFCEVWVFWVKSIGRPI